MMIQLSDTAQAVLLGSTIRTHFRLESWWGDDLLAESVPAVSATEETNRGDRVPERLSVTVPAVHRGTRWSPIYEDHPLAANGQRLRAVIGIELANNEVEWFTRGWFIIRNSHIRGDEVTVEAVGLLTMIDEARLISPYQPTGTFASTLRELVEPALEVDIDAALVDRAITATGVNANYDEDRLGIVEELLDSWPADGRINAEGVYEVTPVSTDLTPVLDLHNGRGGTVVETSGTSTREQAFNVVVAEGQTTDGQIVQGVAYDFTGPKRFGGHFNPLPVPFGYFSPLLTTVAQCEAAADTVLARKKREQAVELVATIVPHPALQTGDVVTITNDDYTDLLCTVETTGLPYHADGGAMTLHLRAVT